MEGSMKKSILLISTISFLAGMMFFGCQVGEEPTASLKLTDAKLYHYCTLTPGWWKTHPDLWPTIIHTPPDPAHENEMWLGDRWYTKDELLDILNEPVRGNGLINLAHHFIAARMNMFSGVEFPPEVGVARDEAHGLFTGRVVPPIGDGYVKPNVASSIAQVLDDYNNGVIGPGHCGD
jgi:hypothetical protein